MDYKDLSIDEAKAWVWVKDVENEIAAVEYVLKNVYASLTAVAGSDDTIMQGISSVGSILENVWTGMCNGFKEAQNALGEVFTKIGTTAQGILDELEGVKGSAGGR